MRGKGKRKRHTRSLRPETMPSALPMQLSPGQTKTSISGTVLLDMRATGPGSSVIYTYRAPITVPTAPGSTRTATTMRRVSRSAGPPIRENSWKTRSPMLSAILSTSGSTMTNQNMSPSRSIPARVP